MTSLLNNIVPLTQFVYIYIYMCIYVCIYIYTHIYFMYTNVDPVPNLLVFISIIPKITCLCEQLVV